MPTAPLLSAAAVTRAPARAVTAAPHPGNWPFPLAPLSGSCVPGEERKVAVLSTPTLTGCATLSRSLPLAELQFLPIRWMRSFPAAHTKVCDLDKLGMVLLEQGARGRQLSEVSGTPFPVFVRPHLWCEFLYLSLQDGSYTSTEQVDVQEGKR